jgi:HAD superfamily hydrolase (TIGR01509 family)
MDFHATIDAPPKFQQQTMSPKAALFDIDGTLVDSNELHVLAWLRAFAASGYDVEKDAVRAQIGKGADMLIPAILSHVSRAEHETLAQAHADIFQTNYRDEIRVFPGAAELLKALHGAGIQVALASSAQEKELQHHIRLLGVGAFLSATCSSDDVQRSKPAPDIFAAVLAKLPSVRAEEALAVGDTPYDVESAAKCGIRTIALRTGPFDDRAFEAAGALAIYDSVADLLADLPQSPFFPRPA